MLVQYLLEVKRTVSPIFSSVFKTVEERQLRQSKVEVNYAVLLKMAIGVLISMSVYGGEFFKFFPLSLNLVSVSLLN